MRHAPDAATLEKPNGCSWRGRELDRLRRRLICTVSVLLALLGAVPWQADAQALPEARAEVAEVAALWERKIPDMMQRHGVAGVSVLLLRDGQSAWSAAFGYADLEEARPLTLDAVFRVESISKPVSAWGVMRLAEQDLIDLDAPVERYFRTWSFPPSPFATEAVTTRHLLGHTAGMPLGDFTRRYRPGVALPELREYLSIEARPTATPGAGFAYSNIGFNLLDLLVEEVTGEAFTDHMAREVLGPLNMHGSGFGWQERFEGRVPTAYTIAGEAVDPYIYPAQASGGLLAPIEDLGRFLVAGMHAAVGTEHIVLSGQGVRELHRPAAAIGGAYGLVAESYGLGHFVEILSDGRQAVWHGGQGYGWMTHFHSVPASGDGIIILSNSQRAWPLIAHVLRDWSRWLGIDPVGMSRIVHAVTAVWAVTAVIALASLVQVSRLAWDVRRSRRRFAPLSRDSLEMRSIYGLFAAGLLLGLVWATAQEYLLLASVAPHAVQWLGLAALGLAVALALSALLPRQVDGSAGSSRP